jgi:hypothetical protein
MGGFIAFLVSLQSTFGPSCFLNEQAVLPDSCLEVMANTVYAPTVLASEFIPPVGIAVRAIQMANREIVPSRRPVAPPTVFYISDDIQYFPKGPEFKLRTAAEILHEAKMHEGK